MVLPSYSADSIKILDWIASNLGNETIISIMNQYTPIVNSKYPELMRTLSDAEYKSVIDFAIAHPDDILLPQVEGFIPSYQYRRYELRDCEQELKFLRFYSYYALKRNVQKMDKNKIRNLLIRSISGAAMLVIMLGALFLSEYTFLALLIVLGVGIMSEFFKLSTHGPSRTTKWLAWLAGSVLIASVILCQDGKCLMALLPLTALIFIVELYRGDEKPLENISVTVCGIAYAAVPMALLAAMPA